MEEERGLGLVDQRRDMTDVDRLVQVDELARLAQTVEELAEILLHRGSRMTSAHGGGPQLSNKGRPPSTWVIAARAGGIRLPKRFPFGAKML